ncbi:nucleoside phosphorylase domain-containing protein [Aspergillus floccosus]
MEAYGGDPYETPVRLTNNLVWYTAEFTAMECRCLKLRDGNHSDLAQVILPSMLSRDQDESFIAYEGDQGAVFFGFNSRYQWHWRDHGHPSTKETGAGHASTPEKIPTHIADSGFDSPGTTPSEMGSGLNESTSRQFSKDPLDISSKDPSFTSASQERGAISSNDYTVGIICALSLEFKAVRALFDETHPGCIPDADTHAYALGRMGKHWVVAAGLPKGGYGTTSAGVVACDMRRSFPSIKFCLLVGIGGGVPSKHDIRLGDIVVSTPSGLDTGVLAYDSVKVLESGEMKLNACLSRPSRNLLSAITALTSEIQASSWELQELVDQITTSCPEYECPGPDQDILFASEYSHEETGIPDSCDGCDLQRQVARPPRKSGPPHVHYGLVASGNQLMRSAQVRDQMSQ